MTRAGSHPVSASPSDYRPPARPRVVVVGLVRHPTRAAVLVSEFAEASGALHHRPVGGGIEFGETSAQALHREFAEELAVEVEVGPRLAVIESLFTFNGAPGHEWVVVHAARLLDDAYLADGRWVVRDAPTDIAVWRPLTGARGIPLHPPGFAELARR